MDCIISTHNLNASTGQVLTVLGLEKGIQPVVVVTTFKHLYGWLQPYTTLTKRGAISKLKKNVTQPLFMLRDAKAMHPDIERCVKQVPYTLNGGGEG